MKYIILGIHDFVTHKFTANGCMISCQSIANLEDSPKPLTFQTRAGAHARMLRESAAGEPMAMAVMELPPSPAAALGKLAAGKPKMITKKESAARALRLATARASRWLKA